MIQKILLSILRIWTGFCILFILYFVIGHMLSEEADQKFASNEIWAFICFPIGVLVGLVITWFNHFAGGLITILSLIAFYFQMPEAMSNFWINFLAAPGLFHLIIGTRKKVKSKLTEE